MGGAFMNETRRARADQAEHVNEMYEGHINALLEHVVLDSMGRFQFRQNPRSQDAIRLQISRMLGHKEIRADHLPVKAYQYAKEQLYPYKAPGE